MRSLVSTCVIVINVPSCTKPNPGVAREAVILIVSSDTDSRFGVMRLATQNIKPFLVTVRLQGGLWANKCLPRVTTQRGVSVFSVSDQWVKRAGLRIDYNESDLFTDLHTETDLGEGRVPVSRQLGLLWVESSLPSSSVVFSFITPVTRIIVKGTLGEQFIIWYKFITGFLTIHRVILLVFRQFETIPPSQPIWHIVSVHLVKEMSAGDMNRERKSPSLSISQSAPVEKYLSSGR